MWDSRSSASNCLHPLQATRPTCHPFSTAKFGRRREHCVRQQRILPQAKQSQEDGGNSQLPGSIQHINKCCSVCVCMWPWALLLNSLMPSPDCCSYFENCQWLGRQRSKSGPSKCASSCSKAGCGWHQQSCCPVAIWQSEF